jgi:hypothetical protein
VNIKVGIAAGYGLDEPGSIPGSTRIFFSPQPVSNPMGTKDNFLGDKAAGT